MCIFGLEFQNDLLWAKIRRLRWILRQYTGEVVAYGVGCDVALKSDPGISGVVVNNREIPLSIKVKYASF